jgi:hypothetical protein
VPSLPQSLLATRCYMTFGRLVWWTRPKDNLNLRTLWCPPRWITPVFVSFDLFAFLVQLAGVSRVGSAFKGGVSPQGKQNDINPGMYTLKLGLGEFVCFGLFALIGFRFFLVRQKGWAPEGVTNWRRLNIAVNRAAGLITTCPIPTLLKQDFFTNWWQLRAISRMFEFTGSSKMGPKNYLNTHEWVFWTCDVLPILRESLGH